MGLFTPAMQTLSARPLASIISSVVLASRPTAVIWPLPLVVPCRRLRWKMTLTAVSSDKAPEAQAEATSPTLCPHTAAG